MVFVFLFFIIHFIASFGKPLSRTLQLHESRQSIPNGWKTDGPAPSDTVLTLRFALIGNDTDGLVDALHAVSNPSSGRYGSHLTMEEVEVFSSPKPESVTAVNAWFAENGLNATTISHAADWVKVEVPVSKANTLLDANFTTFTHTATGRQAIRTLAYSIPVALADHLDLVHPTITFPQYKQASTLASFWTTGNSRHVIRDTANQSAPCGNGSLIDPVCLQHLYAIPTTPATTSSNALAIAEYINQSANNEDLMTFLKLFRPDMNSSGNFTLQQPDGGLYSTDPAEAGSEASLDLQYTVGLATNVPVTFLAVGPYANTTGEFVEALLNTASYLLGEAHPPQVLSTSYGMNEDTISQKLAENLCNSYAQLGARGVSLIFASGDGGVTGIQFNSTMVEGTVFVPTFPSGCPYVTSVGATSGIPVEVTADFSSGGFSNIWSRPDYQSSAVSQYLSQLGTNNSGLFNQSGRAYPDVAAYGEEFGVIINGSLHHIYGTSCSAPTFASIVALINDRRLAAGNSTLGFLNPFLYYNASTAFHDIVSGYNLGFANHSAFYATSGWDPITGLGTPNFTRLEAAAAQMPKTIVTSSARVSMQIGLAAVLATVALTVVGQSIF
ncbi:subtilisin-like protein [Laetiporus sulphureus 93-53]|uniref:tripeptidyl-peptidase II n=1 Tax=Laetiporus sulphureus 93-53 TaxID=1314785 RepID=A0A165CBY0_9APHY|nr:subtilisin-like protein [Laetiporus sulphureus 93-53]KZT02535.1 subtilisin-like protein [Laetiporus sulphureus 93-53]